MIGYGSVPKTFNEPIDMAKIKKTVSSHLYKKKNSNQKTASKQILMIQKMDDQLRNQRELKPQFVFQDHGSIRWRQ